MKEDTKITHNPQRQLSGLSEKQFGLMISSIKDYAIFMLNPDGYIISWNKGAENIKGYLEKEIVGKHFSTFYPPEDIQKGKPEWELKEAIAEGRVEDESWRVRKDGSRFWANVIITPISDETGVLIGFTKVTRDLTERKAAELELEEIQRQLRLMIASVQDYAIFMLNPDGYIISWNKGAENIKGYLEKEIVGKHFSTFYPPEDIQKGKPEWELKEAIAEGRLEDEGWRVRKNGSRFWANVIITPISDETGVLIGFTKVTRDLTERKNAEEKLRNTQQHLLISNRMGGMTRLAGMIAQEYDSMTKAIVRQTKLVMGSLEDSSPLRQRLEEIVKLAETASNMNNQLLAFSSAQVLNPKLIDLNVIVSSIRGTLQWLIGKNVELVTKLSPQIGWVNVDPYQMENVIINLAGRARDVIGSTGKFTIETTNINIKASIPHLNGVIPPGSYVMLKISDTGPALEKDSQNQIFEPFFKSNAVGKEAGLKLSTIYGIIKQSGGQILVNSEVGRGTTFEIYLDEARKV